MAEEHLKNNVISKNNSGFPDYLDFEKLRTDGIEYLGRLAGKVWTDHNLHDPGITILEMLCYALLDLGYRTNLPAVDIFTRNSEDKSKDNNFFTPAQILVCNPVSILDYRKFLVELKGVKNAWLEVGKDFNAEKFCEKDSNSYVSAVNTESAYGKNNTNNCLNYVNGLYHVYIELDENSEGLDEKVFEKNIVDNVRRQLVEHRNLCEDFIDIYVLCKLDTGVCADIELEDNTDGEKVYINIVEKLREFFSPSPRFYTLEEMLTEKQKTIDDIFAGRPHNITESHGFIDTEEFEKIKLKKEIHLSDVYNAIFQVEGVRTIRNLRLQYCKNNVTIPVSGWKFKLPENHIASFSVKCSGFKFTRHEMPIFIEFKKYESFFEINFAHNGKVLYAQPSPYLDSEIPKGVYHNDLDEYFSIQNEFPRVYGIAKGGLSDDASSLRKSQALQLKGYLLFFDQLLSNYLAQLKNIRSLFALSANDNEESHTYFTNNLDSVPDLEKLLRFKINENDSNNLGSKGSVLVFPVSKKMLLKAKEEDKLKYIELEKINPYTFNSLAEQDIAINQLRNDLYNDKYETAFIYKTDECVFYYITTSSDEIALISKKYFKDEKAAIENATSVNYVGTFEENYRSFITSDEAFSFDIELNLLSFGKYLQLIVEDKELFLKRRQVFLDHLLSRFAETFTDYALISFGFYDTQQSASMEIKSKEKFLSGYDELSSNRGKAYDYLTDGWNNSNTSGLEKMFKLKSGIQNKDRHTLCNFVVAEYDDQFIVELKIAGKKYFTIEEKFDSHEGALQAAKLLFNALPELYKYKIERIQYEKESYGIKINYNEDRSAVFSAEYSEPDEAQNVTRNLHRMFSEKVSVDDVFISSYIYKLQLVNHGGKEIRKSVKHYESKDEALAACKKIIKKVNEKKQWEIPKENTDNPGTLYYDSKNNNEKISYIDIKTFKIDINTNIIGKPDKFTYEVLDKGNNFGFLSTKEFENAGKAKANCYELLTLMSAETNYRLYKDEKSGKYSIQIFYNDEIQAICSTEFNNENEAIETKKRIYEIVKQYQYFLNIIEIPDRWRFKYKLGYEKNDHYTFHSTDEYVNPEDALAAAESFPDSFQNLQVAEVKKEILLVPKKTKIKYTTCKLIFESNTDNRKIKESVNKLVDAQKEIHLLRAQNLKGIEKSISKDPLSSRGNFVYRLVDKDNDLAFYNIEFTDRAKAESEIKSVAKQFRIKPDYPDISLGGDIINEKKDSDTKITWYHYRIKCLNLFYKSGINAGKELILFESTRGYVTREEAEKAFKENYLRIIQQASDTTNYGKTISRDEILYHTNDACLKKEYIVFIPKDTLNELGSYTDDAIKKLVEIAAKYPIRSVQYKSEAFYKLFPCEEKEEESNEIECKSEAEKDVYYYRFSGWQSIKYFKTPEEARKEFYFFLILVRYQGNFYVNCDYCTGDYKIYVREVLSESTGRFKTEAEAWGKDGVQKFICISQTEDTFHTYLRKEDCCYSFYLACGNGLVYHPCKYDTPGKRDIALKKLYQSFKNRNQGSFQTKNDKEWIVLSNEKGEPFARVFINIKEEKNKCEWLLRFIEYIYEIDNYQIDKNGYISIINEKKEKIAESYDKDTTIKEWMKMLQTFACYYPIIKTKDQKTGKDKFCLEIKLPGFNSCNEEESDDMPCEKDDSPENTPICYVAWTGTCCYDSCKAAMEKLEVVFNFLLNYENYQPVFDCVCSSYGIALHLGNTSVLEIQNTNSYNEARAHSEIVAFNPQCYSTPEMVCDAVGRAKRLINSEGLHLVEHILLRPRCKEDCDCEQYKKHCDNKTNCNNFTWKDPDDDPCTDDTEICFVPGTDRYSFIATIALPAWPERFRKKENRILLENILYREAPAHVLLRILWLAPHDFCCFESKFKNWNRWLAKKELCDEKFSVCDFMELLFQRNFECLADCDVCRPCTDDEIIEKPCFEELNTSGDPNEHLNQINELFCFREVCCEEYEFIDCEKQEPTLEREDKDKKPPPIKSEPPPEKPGILKKVPSVQKEIIIDKEAGKKHSGVKQKKTPSAEPEPAPVQLKTKPQVVNSRLTKYKTKTEQILLKSRNNPIAMVVNTFLKDPKPSLDRFRKIVTEVVENKMKKKKGDIALKKDQSYELLRSMICYYLDRLIFNGEGMKNKEELKQIFENLRKAKKDIEDIYSYWNSQEVKIYEPQINEEEIRKILTGN